MKSHENISIFGNGKIIYNPQMEIGKPYIRNNKGSSKKDNMIKSLKPIKQINTGFRYPKTVLTFSRDFSAQTRLHPTQKPVELLEYLIKTYTNKNETVLDFTMGSGTTGVACKNLNRNFIGIELDETYFNIAKERIGD
jgi:site-specific DNA-methyltransferase (adenine-specific)